MALDKSEKNILRALQANGRMSNVELASEVGLSESPCLRRVRNLEQRGLIKGYQATLHARELGFQVSAYVQVRMQSQADHKRDAFHAAVQAEEHIVECHAMSGSHDYFMKVIARNMDHFAELSMQRILRMPGVDNIESNFCLQAVKADGRLPIR